MRTVKLLRLLTRSALAVLALLLVTGTSAALAKTIYVDTGGNDAFDGTSASFQGGTTGPVRTIGHALTLAAAGDLISIEAGLYDEDITVSLADLDFEARIDPNGGFTVVQIGDGAGVPEGDLTIAASGVSIGQSGDGSFEIAGDLTLASGSLTVADGLVELTKGGVTITRVAGQLAGALVFPSGIINNIYAGATSITAGQELASDLNGGDLTVAFTAAGQTLTLTSQVEVDDVTVTANSTIAGTLVAAGNPGGHADPIHTFSGGGSVGTVIVSEATSLANVTLSGALTMQSGTVTLAGPATAGSVSMVAGTTLDITGQTLSVTGDFVRTGGTFTGAGTLAFTGTTSGGQFSPGPNFAVTNLTFDKGSQTVTLNQDVLLNGDLTITSGTVNMGSRTITVASAGAVVNNGTLVTAAGGGLVFTVAAATIEGTGDYGNITVLVGAGNDIQLLSDVDFTGLLALSTGGIDANGNDISPSGSNASVERNLASGGTDIQGGTFNADNVEYALILSGDLGAGTVATGDEFETDDIKSLLVTATNGTVDASGAPDGTISGPVTLQAIPEAGDVVATTMNVLFPANVTITGLLTVGESTSLDGTTITIQNNAVVDGAITGALVLDGEVTVTGNANDADFLSSLDDVVVNDNDSATITGIQQITGDLTTNAGSSLNLTLAGVVANGDLTVGGNVVLNGASLTLGSNVDVAGTTAVNNGSLNFGEFDYISTGDFTADTDVAFTAGTGELVFDTAANLGLNGLSIPNLRITGVTVTATQDAIIGNSLVETGAGVLSIGANDLTLNGSTSSDGGIFVQGTGAVTINNNTLTLAGNGTINAPVTVADANTLTVQSSDETTPTPRTLTVDGILTVSGTIALGINSLTLNDAGDNLVNDGGTFTMSSGFVTVNGGDVEPAGTLEIANFATGTATVDVGVASNGTLRITERFTAGAALNENDDNDSVVFAEGALITVNVFPALSDAATFDGPPNLVYNAVVAATGNELPANGNVQSIVVNQSVITDQAVTVLETLTLNAAINNTANTVALTLANNATLVLGIDNAAALATAALTATTYNVTYAGPSDVVSNAEFLANATLNTMTVNAPGNTISLDADRTLNNLVQTAGTVDLAGNDLGVRQNLTLATPANLVNSGGNALLSFVGSPHGTFSLTGNYVVPARIDVQVAKDDTSSVTVSGGDLDLFSNSAAGAAGAVLLMLDGGQLDTAGDAEIVLYQDATTQGYTQSSESSFVTGTVRKRLYAGDPLGTIPGGEPGGGAQRSARYQFPTGAPDGEYRPAALTFRSNVPTMTDISVSHEDVSPEGTLGFPLMSGDVSLGNYPPYYWLMHATTSLGQAQAFDVELTGTQIGLPFDDVDDLRIIRRFDGDATTNAWSVQGQPAQYENFLAVDAEGDTTAVLRVTNSTGGLVPQGARFTLGVPVRAPQITYTDTTGTDVALAGDTLTVNEGETVEIDLQYSSQDIGEDATMEVVSLPEFASIEDHGDGTATLTLAPGYTDAGNYTAELSVSDDGGSTTDVTFTISVNDVNQPIEITGAPADTTTISAGREFTFTLNASDPDGGDVTFELATDTLGATLATTDTSATFSFTPSLDEVGDTLSFTINVSDGVDTVAVTFSVVVEESTFALGDVTLNGEVSAFDAATLLQHVAGLITLNDVALSVADVSGNGSVSAFDAALILQYDAEIITCFPAEDDCGAGKTLAAATGNLAWGEIESATEGLGMYIPISLAGDVSNVYSIELTATIDRELADVKSVSGTRLPEGWQVAYAVNEEGQLRIAMAGTKPLADAGEVARIALELTNEDAQVSVSAEGNINEQGVEFLGEIAAREIPTEFQLGSNYPNPFNPTTTFTYSLPENGKVMIQIFDITGRQVRVLVNEEKDAGVYKVQWDGRNEAGMQVASGMYLYQMRSGSFVDAKKMMLVK